MRISSVFPLFLSVLTLSAGTIVFQDNFNSAPGTIENTNTPGALFSGADFSLTAGSVDLNGPTFYSGLCTATGSTYCVDTTGAGSERGQLTSSAISLAAGSYELSFDLIGWSYQGLTETASVNVALGTLVNQTYSVDGASNPYATDVILFNVTSPTSLSLVFTDTGTNDSATFAGAVLANIEIQSTSNHETTAAPEPGSWMLAGGAMGSLLLLRLGRRRHSITVKRVDDCANNHPR